MELAAYSRGKLEGKKGKNKNNLCAKFYFQTRNRVTTLDLWKQNNRKITFFMYPGFSGTHLWVVSKGKKLSCQAVS